MGFRFRRSIKLLPGLRLNFSKSGISTSIGRPGATLNIGGKGGPRATVGIPGTGLSYTEKLSGSASQHKAVEAPSASPTTGTSFGRLLGWGLVALFVGLVAFGMVSR